MKKLSLIIGSVVIVSNAFAHQISGEFKDSSWNWNNGSHFIVESNNTSAGVGSTNSINNSINNSNNNDRTIVNDVVSSTETMHTHRDGDTHNTMKNVPADKDMNGANNKKAVIFDSGIRPSNSK